MGALGNTLGPMVIVARACTSRERIAGKSDDRRHARRRLVMHSGKQKNVVVEMGNAVGRVDLVVRDLFASIVERVLHWTEAEFGADGEAELALDAIDRKLVVQPDACRMGKKERLRLPHPG